MKKAIVSITAFIAMIVAILLSPATIAVLSFIAASGLLTCGAYLLMGLGWASIACSIPLFILTVVLIRGLAQ